MSNLYNKIEQLCQEAGITITEMCRQVGVTRGNLTDLKSGRQTGLSAMNLDKIASFFKVPVGFLLGRPPFDCWDLINQNRKGFLHYVTIDPVELGSMWNIDINNPDGASIANFVNFLSDTVEDLGADGEGDWIIQWRPRYNKKAPTQEGERIISDDDIKFALWGTREIDDDVLDQVKSFAKFARENRKDK